MNENIIKKYNVLKEINQYILFVILKMASSAGLEPATHCLEGSCSNPTELRGEAEIIY